MFEHQYQAITITPVGKLGVRTQGDYLSSLDFLDERVQPTPPNSPFAADVVEELAHYFKDPQHSFDLPLELTGTDYQQRIWEELCHIPSGETLTYGELAKILKTSPRSLGNACRKNPVPIIIPCHRIVSASGVGGYAGKRSGALVSVKEHLLMHEQCSTDYQH